MTRTASFASRRGALAAIALSTTLAGCVVGPDYHGPPLSAPLASSPGAHFAREAAGAYVPAAPAARWWEALGDPELTRLIDLAMADSPTLAQTEAKVRNARATLSEQRTGLLPQGGGTATYARLHIPSSIGSIAGGGSGSTGSGASSSQSSSSSDSNLYSVGFDATWELDLFGGKRRGIETAKATFQSQQATLQDGQVQLASEVAQNYVKLRDVQARIRLGRETAEVQGREVELTRQRRAAGTASEADVERLVNQLSQTNAQNVPLLAQRDQYLDQLALLTGREPGQLDAELGDGVAIPRPPAQVAIGDPADLIRRRPDIREAERQLAAANAVIGQHIADYFPKLTLFGDVGQSSGSLSSLFSSSSFTSVGAPYLSWNVFNFPKIKAQVNEARADRDAAEENYRQIVLAALQDAEDSLSSFGHQRETLVQQTRARDSAARSSDLTRVRYAGGTASLIDLLDTERQRLSAEQNLSQRQAQLTNAFVALQKSLGLGWGAPPPAPPAPLARSGPRAREGEG